MRLMMGDCLEQMKELGDGSVDLTVTSPPYDNLRTYKDSLDWGEHVWKPVLAELFRVTKDGGVLVWIVGDATIKGSETGTSFRQALYAMECGFNLHDTMIWEKFGTGACGSNLSYLQNFEYMFVFSKRKPRSLNLIYDRKNNHEGEQPVKGMRNTRTVDHKKGRHVTDRRYTAKEFGRRFNIWKINQTGDVDRFKHRHPASFPEQLANDHIVSWSNVGDTVFDPFMGSGTTGKMAVLNGRDFIGIEKVQEYYDIAAKRIEEAITTKASELF